MSYAPELRGLADLHRRPFCVNESPRLLGGTRPQIRALIRLVVARPEGLEPPTRGLEGRRSVLLSYGRARSDVGVLAPVLSCIPPGPRSVGMGLGRRRDGVSEGARTLNPRIHSPVLYRLSYTHRQIAPLPSRNIRTGEPVRASSKRARCLQDKPPFGWRPAFGAPGGNRTPDLRLRRPTLYPTELRARKAREISRHPPSCQRVGAAGFGPATSCAQGRRATRLRYAPKCRGRPAGPNQERCS